MKFFFCFVKTFGFNVHDCKIFLVLQGKNFHLSFKNTSNPEDNLRYAIFIQNIVHLFQKYYQSDLKNHVNTSFMKFLLF